MLLRSVLRTKLLPRRCLVRCRHCGIFFPTHPINGRRKDLGCPFGCGQAHRRSQSTRRSVAYYQSSVGKGKKSDLNQRRPRRTSRGRSSAVPPPSCQTTGPNQTIPTQTVQSLERQAAPVAVPQTASAAWASGAPPAAAEPPSVGIAATGSAPWHPQILEYVRMIVSLIERRPVSPAAVLEMLQTFLRQHSSARRRKIDHTVAWLHEHPP